MWARRWIPSWQVWWGMGGATASGAAIRRVSGGAGQDLGRIGQPFATAALDSWRAFILTPSLDATGKEAHAQVRDRDPATGKIRDIAFKGIIRKVSLLPTIQACHCVHDRWLHSAAFPPLPHCRSPPLLQADSRGEMQSLEWYQASDGEDMVRPVEPAPSSEAVSRSYAAPEAPVSAHADRSEGQRSTSASLAASGRFLRQGAHCQLLGHDLQGGQGRGAYDCCFPPQTPLHHKRVVRCRACSSSRSPLPLLLLLRRVLLPQPCQ